MSFMRTLTIGVTGLLSHQVRMESIANNIANVNTTAYKSTRVLFQDIFHQTLEAAASPTATFGGLNPRQLGTGVKTGSIDNIMDQGSIESTGRLTDVAVQGDGFFSVSATGRGGESDFTTRYTRDGNFALNAGRELLHAATGFKVMGWQVGNNVTNPDADAIDPTLPPTSILLPIGTKKKAKATTGVEFASNLNAASRVRLPEFHTYRITAPGGTDEQQVKFKFTETVDAANNHVWEWSAEITSGGGVIVGPNTGSFTLNDSGLMTANTQPTLVVRDALGNQVTLLVGPADADGVGMATTIDYVAFGTAGSAAYNYNVGGGAGPTVNGVAQEYAPLVVTLPADVALGANGGQQREMYARFDNTLENQLMISSQEVPVTVGLTTFFLRVTWTKGASTAAGAGNGENPEADPAHSLDPDYWQYSIQALDAATRTPQAVMSDDNGGNFDDQVTRTIIFGDSGAVFGGNGTADRMTGASQILVDEDGLPGGATVNITPPRAEDGPTSITFNIANTNSDIFGDFEPGDVHRTSVEVFDSLGQRHNLTFRFTKAGLNVWDAIAALPFNDPAEDSLTGNYLNVSFDSRGAFRTLTFDNPTALPVAPTRVNFQPPGADQMAVNPKFSLATQYEGENSVLVVDQNGFPMGVLQSFAIERNGTIVGVYENGLRIQEAQLSLTRFRNPEGLERDGNNLWRRSSNSGIPLVGVAGSDGFGEIVGGSLELSNVDLAEEFTNMIITQRGFTASARAITTADELLQDVLALKR